MADNLQYFERTSSGYLRKTLGEICTGFNMGFTIDGSKDSAKITYVSYTQVKIKPYTIVYHYNTNSWWVVADDKSERHENEKGYFYIHTVSLLGAIEILNTKDLTDMGCYGNRYTLLEICNKIRKLTPLYDFPTFTFNVIDNCIDLNQKIDYTKTFENYTMLSALRELFDGYNCALKMSFAFNNLTGIITNAYINVLPKSGNGNRVHNENVFNDIREKKEMQKSNYGTLVVSNAQNVVAQNTKTYPSGGSARLSSNAYKITKENAVLRLPSSIFALNWVKVILPVNPVFVYEIDSGASPATFRVGKGAPYYGDGGKVRFLNALYNDPTLNQSQYYNELYELMANNIDDWFDRLERASCVPIYANSSYDGLNNVIYPPTGHINPKFLLLEEQPTSLWGYYEGNVGIMPKTVHDSLINKNGGISWERGQDYIGGFGFVGDNETSNFPLVSYVESYLYTDLRSEDIIGYYQSNIMILDKSYSFHSDLDGDHTVNIKIYLPTSTKTYGNTSQEFHGTLNVVDAGISVANARWVVNYVPMSDIKITYDSNEKDKVGKLYNQNGKLSSANGLSKLMVSYGREILSDKIVRYGTYYDISDVPQVGDIVLINNENYVIGNVSLDFNANEDETYIIYGEFTLSYQVATKSLLTEANTAIRDYNIPQNLNIKRKQIYKDLWELSHTPMNMSFKTPKLMLNKVLNLGATYQPYQEHKAIMKLSYEYLVDGQESWYYQLDTTVYNLKKAIYEVVDFKDNNIIGYDAMSTHTGFLVQEIFQNHTDDINTPISYVDGMGNVADFEIAFCNMDQVGQIYVDYLKNTSGGENYGGDLINYSVFIDSKIFEGVSGTYTGANVRHDFMIEEIDYLKDTIEVPVFEYCCQLDDSSDVVIGDNILDQQNDDICYFYSFAFVNKGTINQNNISNVDLDDVVFLENGVFECWYCCELEYGGDLVNRKIIITPRTYNVITNGVPSYTGYQLNNNLDTTKELVIVRRRVPNGFSTTFDGSNYVVDTQNDLIFIVKNLDNAETTNSGHSIAINLNWFESH